MRRFALLLSVPLLVLCVLAATSAATTYTPPGNVASSESWGPAGSGATHAADVIWIQSSIAVNSGVTLTMLPGTIVKFNLYTTLVVNGGLQANGTLANTITFTSIRDDAIGGDTNGDGAGTTPAPSDWGGVTFTSAAPDSSRLLYSDLRFAGYGSRGALQFNGVTGRVTNSFVRQSYYGVECLAGATPALVSTEIQSSTVTPVVMDLTAQPLIQGLVFSGAGTGYNAFGLYGGGLSAAASVPKRAATVGVTPITNVTYVLLSTLTINPTGSLTISPGIVLKPLSGVGILVDGSLTMNGTVTDTITVTSINDDNFGQPRDTNNNGSITAPNRGDWSQINFRTGSSGSLQYCRLKFGTNSTYNGMLETVVNLPVSNTLLSDAGHGIAIHGAISPTLTTVAINNCSSAPILMSVTSTPGLANISFLGNSITALALIGEAITQNAHLTQRTVAGFANITYYVMNAFLTMQSPSVLTVDPGVVVKFQYSCCTGLDVEGALVANGTALNPIVFTSERDDAYGNPPDTNGDGATTAPARGDWGYILFGDTSIDGTCVLNNCRVTYGSGSPFDGYPCNIWTLNASPTISNCTITQGYFGIRLQGSSAPAITSSAITNCYSAPIVMSVTSDPTLTGNTFQTNGLNGLALIAETLTQSATLKYRPSVTFPSSSTVFAYVPWGTITIPAGMTLSIQPQVVMKPRGGGVLFDVSGTLNMVGGIGTPPPPLTRIIVTSLKDDSYDGDTNADGSASSASVNDWGIIQFEDASVDAQCRVRNCLFQFGGYGVITTTSASPKVAACEFFSNQTALVLTGASYNAAPAVVLDSLKVLNCTYLPIVFSLISDPTFPSSGSGAIVMANNAYTALGIIGETIAQDVRLNVRVLGPGILNNIAYIPTSTISIAFGAKWTIAPGIVLKMGRACCDYLGTAVNIDGALVANGKPDSLIVLTVDTDDAFGGDTFGDGSATLPFPGAWGGIAFSAVSNAAATVINNCRFRYGGYFGYVLSITNANESATNTVISHANNSALLIQGNAAPTFTAVNVDTSNIPVRMSLVSNPTFTNVHFIGNNVTALALVNETIAQDLLWKIRAVSDRQNMPYYIDGTVGVGLGSTVTLQPGVIVKLRGGAIDVNRAFIAVGRTQPDSQIVFTSFRDDLYGGRTDTTSTTTAAAPGDWGYVTIEGTAIDPQVQFHDCVFRYGGSGSTYGALRAVNSAPTVDSTVFAFNQVGVSVEGASNPTVHGCSLYGNSTLAINNPGGSFCVSATGNWWGAANGPNDSNAAADVCGVGKINAGSGDAVTNNVDYSGWTSGGLVNPMLGDVSLNGQVLAYDASLILQYLVPSISLTPLQKLVADVDDSGTITGLDASFILQLAAGRIFALPGGHARAGEAPPAAAREAPRRAAGSFQVAAGIPARRGDEWLVPVRVSGSAPIFAAEVELDGPAAATLSGVDVAGGALVEYGTPAGSSKVVLASAQAIPAGEIVTLHYPALGPAAWEAPVVAWARVNNEVVPLGPAEAVPAATYLAPPAPNPAGDRAAIVLGVGGRDDGARAQ
ncbi:MAG TPA: right-handed parallel beta-helix repeat-containing protein, partial [Candidatus Eisenbacteria bacterium]